MTIPRPVTGLAHITLLAALAGSGLAAQAPAPAATYAGFHAELMRLSPLQEQSAAVRPGLTLKRDVGEFVFEEGRLWLLSPVNGRTIGVAFQGKGRFHFAPPSRMEQERLREFKKVTELSEPFTEVVILFADSTLDELRRTLSFGPGEKNDDLRRRTREALSYLGKEDDKSFDPDVLLSLLNGVTSDLFYAHMANGGDPWTFIIDPHEVEGVRLLVRARHTSFTRLYEVVTQFPRVGVEAAAETSERRPEARIRSYQIESWMTQDLAGDLKFAAAARIEVTSDSATGPWIAFSIFSKLELDSVKTDSGQAVEAFKAKDYDAMLVRLAHALQPGEVVPITAWYHGNVIDRFGEWFFINSSISWYPVAMDGRSLATFDLTFHHPRSLTLASVGERKDSSLAGTVETARWATSQPIRNASFNIGIFDAFEVTEAGVPPITLLSSEKGHRELHGGGSGFGGIRQRVSADVTAAMKFFQNVYGESPVQRFYATEIPWLHGEAFPGLINLSFATFAPTADDGSDEVFRAHEVAHQWWGIGVDFATYHDRWLSEGFSDFSGLWFLQTRRGDNRRYFNTLERWRADIMLRRNQPIPIWLGHRVATASTPEDYNAIIYEKGAWVLNMLRMLTLDLRTMKEDRFTAIMRGFYQSYHGRRASTEDFRSVVEHEVGADMKWFFDEWVYGSAMPTYRVAWKSEAWPDGTYRVRLRVRQENVPPDFLMYVPVTVDLGGDRLARIRVKVTGAVTELELPVALPSQPKALRFNDMEGVLAEVKTEGW